MGTIQTKGTPMKTAAKIAKDLGLSIDETLVLQSAHIALLAAAARGEIDLNRLAQEELASRGLDCAGKWVGFEVAARVHHVR